MLAVAVWEFIWCQWAHFLDIYSLSCVLRLAASTRTDNNACAYCSISPLCLYACMSQRKDMQAVCAPPTSSPAPPASLRGFACWVKLCSVKKQKKKKGHLTHFHNLLLLALPLPAEGVCVCVCHRQRRTTSQTFISAWFCFQQQTPQGDNKALFSHHSKVPFPFLALQI